MARIKVPSIGVNFETLENYDINPFSARNSALILVKLLCLPFFGLHLLASFFTIGDDSPLLNLIDGCLLTILLSPLILISYAFGIIIVPIQIVTFPFAYLYLMCSEEKYNW